MVFKLTYTRRFQKHFKNLNGNTKKQIKSKLELLTANPYHPSLRTKRIQGTDNIFECSVNMDIRIIWYYENHEVIVLLDVGRHEILNQY